MESHSSDTTRSVPSSAPESTPSVWAGAQASTGRRFLFAILSFFIAALIWFPQAHRLYTINLEDYRRPSGVPPKVRAIAARHLRLWTDPVLRKQEIDRMRGSNAEWDFMGRTFFVMALANLCYRDQASQSLYLEIIDRIIGETIRIEREKGMFFFLMDYSKDQPFLASPARSIFVDGEIALMLAARQAVQPRDDFRPLLNERVEILIGQMGSGTVMCGESYPNECWMFCNTVAAAAIRMHDIIEKSDHSVFLQRWLTSVKEHLVNPQTGLLISSFMLNGAHGDGPEGSTIWLVAHCLDLLDRDFARDQYTRARKELIRTIFRFPYSMEWPDSCPGGQDIDSGPIIPWLQVSTGASGLAFLGAATFDDHELLAGLLSSLEFGGFPIQEGDSLRYGAGNQVGNAVLLYALTCGPLWEDLQRRSKP